MAELIMHTSFTVWRASQGWEMQPLPVKNGSIIELIWSSNNISNGGGEGWGGDTRPTA